MNEKNSESESEELGPGPVLPSPGKFKMGSKFKQSLQHIEEFKRKGKPVLRETGEKVFLSEGNICDKDLDVVVGPTDLTSCDPPPPSNNHSDLTRPLRSQAEVTLVVSVVFQYLPPPQSPLLNGMIAIMII